MKKRKSRIGWAEAVVVEFIALCCIIYIARPEIVIGLLTSQQSIQNVIDAGEPDRTSAVPGDSEVLNPKSQSDLLAGSVDRRIRWESQTLRRELADPYNREVLPPY